jgi:hypothetical protein
MEINKNKGKSHDNIRRKIASENISYFSAKKPLARPLSREIKLLRHPSIK